MLRPSCDATAPLFRAGSSALALGSRATGEPPKGVLSELFRVTLLGARVPRGHRPVTRRQVGHSESVALAGVRRLLQQQQGVCPRVFCQPTWWLPACGTALYCSKDQPRAATPSHHRRQRDNTDGESTLAIIMAVLTVLTPQR